jgi:hypothetical protein
VQETGEGALQGAGGASTQAANLSMTRLCPHWAAVAKHSGRGSQRLRPRTGLEATTENALPQFLAVGIGAVNHVNHYSFIFFYISQKDLARHNFPAG